MQEQSGDRMPAFRESFPQASDEEYSAIEDRLEAYLLLTIRFVFEDAAAGRLDLTISQPAPTMEDGAVEPNQQPTNSLP